MRYTGEQLILGAPETIGRTQKEHLKRYDFTFPFTKNKRVLDIACGTGYGVHLIKSKGEALYVHGVDISDEAIKFARDKYKINGIDFFIEDAQKFTTNPLGELYDVITSFETIEHVDDYEKTLNNFYNLLQPGGLLIISTPNRPVTSPSTTLIMDKPNNPFHVREFSSDEFQIIVQKNFTVSDADLFGQCASLHSDNRYINKLMKILYKKSTRYSPEVRPIKDLPSLKYLVITAHKSIK